MFKKNRVYKYLLLMLIVTALVLIIVFFLRYVPFYFPSYCFWTGVFIACIGCLGIILPIKKVRLKTRIYSAILAVSGLVFGVSVLFLPFSISSSNRPHQKLDNYLPQYQSIEYHEERVRLPVERVVEALQEVTVNDIPIAVLLMKIRYMAVGKRYHPDPDPTPLLNMKMFIPLDKSDNDELVFGMIGTLNRSNAKPVSFTPNAPIADQFKAFNQPGYYKVVLNFRIMDEGEGIVRVSTETRVLGTDKDSQTVFARYWSVIYPGSSIIRKLWIDAVIDKARRL